MLKDEVQPILPQPTGDFTGQDPATMEQMFNPSRTEPEQRMPTGGRQFADASGGVPDPEQRPPMPQQAPGQDLSQGLTKPDDTRYKDPQNLIMSNVMMGGMLPWAQATADVASGRVPMERFDEVRQEHQRRIEELEAEHQEFKGAAEKAMPFLEGLGFSIAKPAKTVKGAMAAGAAVAAPQGAAKGYSSGPVEEPSASSTRAAAAVGGAATNAALGAAGGAVGAGASKLIGKTTSVFAERAARKAEDARGVKLDNDAKAASLAAEGKKAATADKAANTKRLAAMDKDMAKREATYNTKLVEDYQRHNAMPQGVSKHWEENRKVFAADPVHAFNQAAEQGMGLEGLSKSLNLPPSVILARLGGKKVDIAGPGHDKLMKDLLEADRVGREFKERGLKVPEAAKPGAKPPAEPPATPPADPAAPPPAGPSAPPKTPKPPKPPKEPKPPKAPKAPKPDPSKLPPGSLGRFFQDHGDKATYDTYKSWATQNKAAVRSNNEYADARTRFLSGEPPPKPPRKSKTPDYISPRPPKGRPQGRK